MDEMSEKSGAPHLHRRQFHKMAQICQCPPCNTSYEAVHAPRGDHLLLTWQLCTGAEICKMRELHTHFLNRNELHGLQCGSTLGLRRSQGQSVIECDCLG